MGTTFDYLHTPLTDARTAHQMAAAEAIRNNNSRNIPPVPFRIRELDKQECVWIYNVGPFAFRREMGSAGNYFIPLCKDGEQYAVMSPIPGSFHEYIIKDETEFELRFETGLAKGEQETERSDSGGMYMAKQIVGVGKMLSPADALTHKGVFIGSQVGPRQKCEKCHSKLTDMACRNRACDIMGTVQPMHPVPLESEISAALQTLDRFYHDLTNEADLAERKGPDEAKNVIQDLHHQAAAAQKLDPREHPWMRRNMAQSQTRQTCPVDGTVSDAGILLCPTCRYIFDPEKYEKIKARMA